MFKRKDDDDISLSDARERMRRLLSAQPADVTTTCTEPRTQPDTRVVRGTGMHRQSQAAESELPTPPTRRDVLAALSNLLALCRAVGVNERKDVAEIETGLLAVFNDATACIVPSASDAATLPKSRRLSEQFESDVN